MVITVIYVEETIRCWPWQAQAWFAFSPTWLTFDWTCCVRRPPVVRTAWHSNLNSKGVQVFHLALRVIFIYDLFRNLNLDVAVFLGFVSRWLA